MLVGGTVFLTWFYTLIAEAQLDGGQLDESLSTIDKTLNMVENTGERFYEAELHRLQGLIFVKQGLEADAESD